MFARTLPQVGKIVDRATKRLIARIKDAHHLNHATPAGDLHYAAFTTIERLLAERIDSALVIDQLKAALHEAYRDSFYSDSERQEKVAFHCLLDDDSASTRQEPDEKGRVTDE